MDNEKTTIFPDNILYRNVIPEWRVLVRQEQEVMHFAKGTPVFKEGDPVKGVFFIDSGKVKIHQRWGAAKEMIIRFSKDGDMIGYRGLTGEKRYPVSATALEATCTLYINLSFFETTLKANAGLVYALMRFYAEELELSEKRVRNMAIMEVRGRIAEALLYLNEYFGRERDGFIGIRLTKQEIASYVGTTYETVSRVIAEFAIEKLIKISGKQIGILREKALRSLVKGQ